MMSGASPGAAGGPLGPAGAIALAPGSVVAGYRIEERLGTGGMAIVYRAVDERLGRKVALKVLAPELSADAAFRERFIRESRAAAAVDDPHIIPVFEAGEDRAAGDVLFIAMRLVPGGDVHTLVRQAGPLPPGRAALILSQAASALDSAHRYGLVHRDVKPANMLMDVSAGGGRPDHVYLSDFGLSKITATAGGLTATGIFIGTPDYAAPEQIEGTSIDGRTDQYSLACSAFELLSGAVPFPREQALASALAHVSEPPPQLTSRRPDLPWQVDAVLARALAKSPADRYATCREFTDALREALGLASYDSGHSAVPPRRTPTEVVATIGGSGVPRSLPPPAEYARYPAPPAYAGPTPPGSPAPLPSVRPPRRTGPVAVVAVGVIVAAGIVTGALLLRPGSPAANSPGGRHTTPPTRGLRPSRFSFAAALDPGVRPAGVWSLAFGRHAQLVTGGASGRAYLWGRRTSSPLATLPDPGLSQVIAVALSADGRTLAVGAKNGQVYLWNLATRSLVRTLNDPGSRGVLAVSISPSGSVLAVGDRNGATYLWSPANGHLITSLPDTGPGSQGVDTLAFSRDGSELAAGDYNGRVYVWQVATSALLAKIAVPATYHQAVTTVAFSPDGKLLAAGSYDGTTYLWHAASWGFAQALTDPDGSGVEAIAFSPVSHLLVTGAESGRAYLWRLGTGALAQTVAIPGRGHHPVWAVAFSQDGSYLAVGDYLGVAYLWRAH